MNKGKFIGSVDVRWLKNGRDMQLLSEFSYIDSAGRVWKALKYAIINGANIPKFFWHVIGSPFVGLYRGPSVIHDVYCENHLRPAQEVHDCFNEMMFTKGVSDVKRETMFNAVDKFGPRW